MNEMQPPDDAYWRVTDRERFGVLHAVADGIVETLTATHDVEVVAGDPTALDAAGRLDIVRVVELVPSDPEAATLTFGYTGFPGLMVRVGPWHQEAFPGCGCDACDEQPDDLERHLRWLVTTVTRNGFAESLSGRWYSVEFGAAAGTRRSSRTKLSREEMRRRRPAGGRTWRPWPSRADGFAAS